MAKPQFRSLIALVLLVTISIGTIHPFSPAIAQPTVVKDPTLKVQLLAQGLRSPTSMAFLGPSDILVLEKDSGTGTEDCKWYNASTTRPSSPCFNNK